MVAVESKDMTQKLQTTLASGGEMPDVAWLEATYRGKLLSLDIWEDITKDPYNFDTSQVLDYLLPLETAESGQYVGPECPSVAGMAYKRELAKEYLGTDDPAELETMLSDWDSFIEKGKEVKEKSGGKVFMLSSIGAAGQMLMGQSTEPFVDGDKINLETSMKPIFEKLIEMKQAGIVDVLDFSSAEETAHKAAGFGKVIRQIRTDEGKGLKSRSFSHKGGKIHDEKKCTVCHDPAVFSALYCLWPFSYSVFTWCQFYKLGRNRRNDLCGSEELCAGVYTG